MYTCDVLAVACNIAHVCIADLDQVVIPCVYIHVERENLFLHMWNAYYDKVRYN